MIPNRDNREIISTKSQGFYQTPQDIMEEYNGCSVLQYRRYPTMSSHAWVLEGVTTISRPIYVPSWRVD
jgi:hypothetical protein